MINFPEMQETASITSKGGRWGLGTILEFSLGWFWSMANCTGLAFQNDTLAFGVCWHCCWFCANLATLSSSSEAGIMVHFYGSQWSHRPLGALGILDGGSFGIVTNF